MAVSPPASSLPDTTPTNEKVDISENDKVDLPPEKAGNSSRVRKVGSRNNDSQNGKSCHQCRQKTRDLAASCTRVGKRCCCINICRKCLLNRYGENVEEVAALTDWLCPKCRGICNCSLCMKKKGHKPTGILVHAAKQYGFSSVHELLDVQGPDVVTIKDNVLSQGLVPEKRKNGKENTSSPHKEADDNSKLNEKRVQKKLRLDDGDRNVIDDNSEHNSRSAAEFKEENFAIDSKESSRNIKDNSSSKPVDSSKLLRNSKSSCKDVTAVVTLPQKNDLLTVAGVELPSEDVGPALQFLEFCNAFGEFFDLEKGQAELVLREMMNGRLGRGGLYSSTVQFHVKLLSVLKMNPEEDGNSWKEILEKWISEFEQASKYLSFCKNNGPIQYDELDSSQKLRVLNFLCDEALGSEDMRSWIEKATTEFTERNKGAKKKVIAAKEKEKLLKQKLKDELAQAILSKNGDSLSISEHENMVSEIKSEAEKAYVEKLEAMGMVPKMKQADALRTQPIIMDENGRVFWRLKSCSSDEHCIMLQEVGDKDVVTPEDKWYGYKMEDEKEVEQYISFIRKMLKQSENGNMVVPESDNPVNDEPVSDDSPVT
ncbi:uncharacterized protein [Aristolochia californica]|uniref:uncharacterized protein n=1 Tax=Aristolochia californica TaxID=171875 RepID=UPI0035DB235F